MEDLHFDLHEVFNEIINRLQDEGAFDREAYDDMVDEVLEEKVDMGELSIDDDIEVYKEQLRTRWPDAEAAFESGHDDTILDQE
jgi:hypothetical protein